MQNESSETPEQQEDEPSEFDQIIERLDRLEAMLERAITSIENIPVNDRY